MSPQAQDPMLAQQEDDWLAFINNSELFNIPEELPVWKPEEPQVTEVTVQEAPPQSQRSPSIEIIESPRIEIVERTTPRKDWRTVIDSKKRKEHEWYPQDHFKKSRRDPELLQDEIRLLKSENERLHEAYSHVSKENKYWQERYSILEREFAKTEQKLQEIQTGREQVADQIQSIGDCSIAIKDHLKKLFGSIERQIAIEREISKHF